MSEPLISVVIPTLNEKDNIEPLVAACCEALRDYPFELIFMDDSTDDTPQVIAALQERNPMVRLVHREHGTGLATAVAEGFALARGQLLACMDADLQHPPELLPRMYRALCDEQADICIPSRRIEGGQEEGLNLYRRFVSATARELGRLLLPCLRRVSDPTGGFFLLRREVLDGAELHPVGWKILIEVLAVGHYKKVIELPYAFSPRNAGSSKLSAAVTLDYLRHLRQLRKRTRADRRR